MDKFPTSSNIPHSFLTFKLVMMNSLNNDQTKGSKSLNPSKNSRWHQLKSFFTAKPKKQKTDSEIDYYHQYIFPSKVHDLAQIRKQTKKNRF